MDVGFIGLGRMGSAMARNLAKAGHRVLAWNRSGAAGKRADGVEVVDRVRDVFQSEVVFTMLSDDAAIREVVLTDGVLQHARAGLVHVVASTISLAFVDELRARHDELRIAYVAAPVFGRPDAAESAQLNIVAAGSGRAIERVQPLLDLIGRRTWIVGDDPKQANAVKVAGNMMIALAIEAMAEAVALTQASEVEPKVFLDLMTQTLFGGRVYENYGAKIAQGDFEAGFRMLLGLKDLGLASAAAQSAGKRLALLEAVHAQMRKAVDAGMGERDWSALADYTLHHDH